MECNFKIGDRVRIKTQPIRASRFVAFVPQMLYQFGHIGVIIECGTLTGAYRIQVDGFNTAWHWDHKWFDIFDDDNGLNETRKILSSL